MPRARLQWKAIRAHRERGVIRSETALGDILEAAKPPVPHAFVEWNTEPEDYWPGINPETGPVTIYGPDGVVRERIPAEEFRRRYPPALKIVRRPPSSS